MDLETVKQNEISQKGKIKYEHIYVESEKIGIDELIYKAEIETWSQRTNMDTKGEREGWGKLGG